MISRYDLNGREGEGRNEAARFGLLALTFIHSSVLCWLIILLSAWRGFIVIRDCDTSIPGGLIMVEGKAGRCDVDTN